MVCQRITAKDIATPFHQETISAVQSLPAAPHLVAFLANTDPSARQYANATAKKCQSLGLRFSLRQVDREQLEDEILKANEDADVHGILVYYPVFGDRQDQYLQNCVCPWKDVEGLGHQFLYNLYHNVRTMTPAALPPFKSVIPCTPLAIVKILEYCHVYNVRLAYGDRLHGKTITIVNRSEVVGRPLAAMLANDGAKVYSADVHGVHEYHRGTGLRLSRHRVTETSLSLEEVVKLSDVVISGVPVKGYRVPAEWLKEGAVVVNFSTEGNFDEEAVNERAGMYVPAVGQVTIAMLARNLVRLAEYQRLLSATQDKTDA